MNAPLTTDERNGADHCWIWRDSQHYPRVSFTKPDQIHPSVEYMRVMSREEIEKLAQSYDGVDAMQLINSLMRTVDRQRREIARMHEQRRERLAQLTPETSRE